MGSVIPFKRRPGRSGLTVGTTIGRWTIAESTQNGRYKTACVSCGYLTEQSRTVLELEPQRRCMGCTPRPFRRPRLHAVPAPRDLGGLPDVLPWRDRRDGWSDAEMRRIASVHGALTLDEVAACMGLSRERIRQIQVAALAKLGAAMRAEGWTEAQAHEWLAGARSAAPMPDHVIEGSQSGRRTDVHGYLYEERLEAAEAPSDCEPGEPMAAACLAELERLERRVRAVVTVLDAARPSAELEAAE